MSYPLTADAGGIKVRPERMERERLYHCVAGDKVMLVYRDNQDVLHCYEVEESELVKRVRSCPDRGMVDGILARYAAEIGTGDGAHINKSAGDAGNEEPLSSDKKPTDAEQILSEFRAGGGQGPELESEEAAGGRPARGQDERSAAEGQAEISGAGDLAFMPPNAEQGQASAEPERQAAGDAAAEPERQAAAASVEAEPEPERQAAAEPETEKQAAAADAAVDAEYEKQAAAADAAVDAEYEKQAAAADAAVDAEYEKQAAAADAAVDAEYEKQAAAADAAVDAEYEKQAAAADAAVDAEYEKQAAAADAAVDAEYEKQAAAADAAVDAEYEKQAAAETEPEPAASAEPDQPAPAEEPPFGTATAPPEAGEPQAAQEKPAEGAEAQPAGGQEEGAGDAKPERNNIVFIGQKSTMDYVQATLTRLSNYHFVTITARGKRITLAVDVSQMIVKRMNKVGYEISEVRIGSDTMESEDGKIRNVSTIEIDIVDGMDPGQGGGGGDAEQPAA